MTPASGWKNSGAAVSIKGNACWRLQFHKLDWERNRLLFGHHQSSFNHNGRPHHRDSYFYSSLNTTTWRRPTRVRRALVLQGD